MKNINRSIRVVLFLVAGVMFSLKISANTGSFDIRSNSFKDLYNNYRQGQPKNTPWPGTYFPYSRDGIGWDFNSEGSPAQKFDKVLGLGSVTYDWEKGHHSCDVYTSEATKADCAGWYGHCNAWAAASIKEVEPRETRAMRGVNFTVGDQKALLTELWMDLQEHWVGHTQKKEKTGDWVKNPNDPISQKINQSWTYYDSFWDVSPRGMFLVLTNYLGIYRVGVVIDRFTGYQVWNQPLVGYQIAKLSPEDLGSVQHEGQTIYTANISTTIYWANDNVQPNHVASKFDIRDPHSHGGDYAERTLSYTLHFDAPVELDGQGNVVRAGNLVGPGVWAHQLQPDLYNLDQTHPDFIWYPTDLAYRNGYGNIYTTGPRVHGVMEKLGGNSVPENPPVETPPPVTPPVNPPVTPPVTPPETPPSVNATEYKLTLARASFVPMDGTETERVFYRGKVFRRLRDGGVASVIDHRSVEVTADAVNLTVRCPNGESLEKVLQVLASFGIRPL